MNVGEVYWSLSKVQLYVVLIHIILYLRRISEIQLCLVLMHIILMYLVWDVPPSPGHSSTILWLRYRERLRRVLTSEPLNAISNRTTTTTFNDRFGGQKKMRFFHIVIKKKIIIKQYRTLIYLDKGIWSRGPTARNRHDAVECAWSRWEEPENENKNRCTQHRTNKNRL